MAEKKAKAITKKTVKKTVSTVKKSEKSDMAGFLKSFGDKVGDINKKIDWVPINWVVDRVIGDGEGRGGPGGFPRGFFSEIYGPEGTGKTTFCLHAVKNTQDLGERVVWLDFEKSLRAQQHYLRNMGINTTDKEKLLVLEPDTYEEGIKMAFQACVQLKPALLVVDSLAAAVPAKFLSGDADEAIQVGLHARQTGVFISSMNKIISKTNTAVVLINQLRSNIKASRYDAGPNEITTGGKAQKYYMHLRIQLKTGAKEDVASKSELTGISEKKVINQEVKVTAVKNKLDVPWKTAPVYITFGKGIDSMRSLLLLAEKKKVIKATGAWYSYQSLDDPNISFKLNGKSSVVKYLEDHPEVVKDMQPHLLPKQDMEAYAEAKQMGDLEEGETLDESNMDSDMLALLEDLEEGLEKSNADPETSSEE